MTIDIPFWCPAPASSKFTEPTLKRNRGCDAAEDISRNIPDGMGREEPSMRPRLRTSH
jgi:hypothetical protein